MQSSLPYGRTSPLGTVQVCANRDSGPHSSRFNIIANEDTCSHSSENRLHASMSGHFLASVREQRADLLQ